MVVEPSSHSEKPTPSSQEPVSTLHNSLPAFPLSPSASPQPDSTVADPQIAPSMAQPKLTNSETSESQSENIIETSSSPDSINSEQLKPIDDKPLPGGASSPSEPNNSRKETRLQQTQQQVDSRSTQEGTVSSKATAGGNVERTKALDIQKPVSTLIEVVDGHCSQPQSEEDLGDNFE